MSESPGASEGQHVASNELAVARRADPPLASGHTVVTTRADRRSWWTASDAERLAVLALVDEVRSDLTASHQPSGFHVGFDSDVEPTVRGRLEIHVIPKYAAADTGPSAISAREGAPTLFTPRDDAFFRALARSLADEALDRIDLVVSFVMRSGVDVLGDRLDEAIARGACVRLLTSDYLGITDPAALGFFVDRIGTNDLGGSLTVRVFSDQTTSFHPKAYIFSRSTDGQGVAFVGSSNLSASGIRDGIEWNLAAGRPAVFLDEFDRLWDDERATALDAAWLRAYEERRVVIRAARLAAGSADPEVAESGEADDAPIAPWGVQREALSALEATRAEGHAAGLVVMATGLGKTWLAAFDSTRPQFRRVLFVAHREEILTQARDTFRRMRPGGELSMFIGDERATGGEVVFAGIQALQRNLDLFDEDAFDYVVVDEFHHAAAPTYRRVIAHFRPKFLLGLTATPDRSDAADLLALCDDNLVYECGLIAGITAGLLSPFQYRAIRDVADYEHIPWRGGRFDVEELSLSLETQQRADQVFSEWSALGGPTRRTIGFCCSISHAEYMADHFRQRGITAAALHSGPDSAPRRETLDRFGEGEIPVIFTVDLFNEGLDIPTIDTVLLLRPTESPIVFFQQLGRGLRAVDGKEHLDVVDLVGNHRSFLLKARLLAALAGSEHLTPRQAVAALHEPVNALPEGCSIIVDVEVVDMLEALVGAPRKEDRITELVLAWADEHDGSRPTALELALQTNRAHELKKAGGWFGFLDAIGALSSNEREVLERARDFLIEIEHGAYTKSYKLVTLQALGSLGTLCESSELSAIYEATLRAMFRDPRLTSDLNDATANFADPWSPTAAEWARYWRRNPIAAWLGENAKGSTPFFVSSGDDLTFAIDIEPRLRPTFEAMVAELVEYRMYRYLVRRSAKATEDVRKPLTADGHELDATFSVGSLLGRPVSIQFASAGGTASGGNLRNPDYVAGVDVVLDRLRALGATILDAYVDSDRVQDLPVPDRRLNPGSQGPYPIDLDGASKLEELRRSMLNSMRGIGRAPGAKTAGGNNRKAMRVTITGLPDCTGSELADYLGGTVPVSAFRAAQTTTFDSSA